MASRPGLGGAPVSCAVLSDGLARSTTPKLNSALPKASRQGASEVGLGAVKPHHPMSGEGGLLPICCWEENLVNHKSKKKDEDGWVVDRVFAPAGPDYGQQPDSAVVFSWEALLSLQISSQLGLDFLSWPEQIARLVAQNSTCLLSCSSTVRSLSRVSLG